MQEIWKTVVTENGVYENYMVSNYGRIKSLNYLHTGKERILKQGKDGIGYLHVTLYKNGKRKIYKVHRLTAMAFIPNVMNYKCIDHRDTNKQNNNILNLIWVTHEQNMNNELSKKKISEVHKGKKRTEETKKKISKAKCKKVICLETGYIFQSTHETERQLNINHVSKCCNRKYKQTGKLTFRYLDQVLFYN